MPTMFALTLFMQKLGLCIIKKHFNKPTYHNWEISKDSSLLETIESLVFSE